jgi:hypothetical protein
LEKDGTILCIDVVTSRKDEETGIYRLKMVGRLPFPMQVVEKVLFDNKLRVLWDTVVDEISEVEHNSDGTTVLYIRTKTPPGISNRDFVHLRDVKEFPKDNSKVVLDVSTEYEKLPPKSDYIR